MVGTTISHYTIVEKLGEGGMGVVYKARDINLNRDIALKFLPHGLRAGDLERARFLQEARAAALLNHPNICTIHDIQECGGEYFIVMEYVEGVTLRRKIEDGKLRIHDGIGYAIQIAEALQEAHCHGIIHRDIKTDNIMVNSKNQIKVMDFGLAKLKGSLRLTRTSGTIGTLAYMSPEQVQGQEADARSDIFSFGAVFFEMLTGHLPFRGEHEAAIIYSIVNDEPVPIRQFITDLGPECLHILDKALEKDPADRYQNAVEIINDLRHARRQSSRVRIMTQSGQGLIEPTTPREGGVKQLGMRLASRKLRWVIGLAVIIAAICTGILLFWPFRSHTPKVPSTRLYPLTFTGTVRQAVLSHDAQFVAYVTEDSSSFQRMYISDRPEHAPLELWKSKEIRSFCWTPDDGELLATVIGAERIGTILLGRFGGYVRTYGFWSRMSWSPDGKSFAGENFHVIGIHDTQNGDTTQLVVAEKGRSLREIDWSPRGSFLAYIEEFLGGSIIWSISPDGRKKQKVVEDSVFLGSPRWSRDGDALYYLRWSGPTADLMKIQVSPETGSPEGACQLLQSGLETSQSFNISKDNKRLLYLRQSQFSNLWLVEQDPRKPGKWTNVRQLTTGTGWNGNPMMSPDGGVLAWTGYDGAIRLRSLAKNFEQLLPIAARNFSMRKDAMQIAFVTHSKAGQQLHLYNLVGGQTKTLGSTDLSGGPWTFSYLSDSIIVGQQVGNKNLGIYDLRTGKGGPIIKNDSVGFLFDPLPSPDGKRIAVFWNRAQGGVSQRGLWVINLVDSSQTFVAGGEYAPIQWSEDGHFIVAWDRLARDPHLKLVPLNGDSAKNYAALPFKSVSGLIATPDWRRFVCVIETNQADAWIMETFDPAVVAMSAP